jgi:hypothetical protein
MARDEMHTQDALQEPLVSPLLDALHGRRLELNDGEGRGDFLTAYAFQHRRLFQALNAMADTVDHDDPLPALNTFTTCALYAAELFEFYTDDLPGYIPGLSRVFERESLPFAADLAEARRPWASLRNRCRRQHAFLASVQGRYGDGRPVSGFCIYGRRGHSLRINKQLFGDTDACAFDWARRALIGDVLKAEVILAAAVDRVPDRKAEPVDCLGLALPYMAMIDHLETRPKLGLPGERAVGERAICRADGGVRVGDTVEAGQGPFLMTVAVEFVGNAVTIQLPYVDGEVEVMGRALGGGGLTSGVHRVAIRDVEVAQG